MMHPDFTSCSMVISTRHLFASRPLSIAAICLCPSTRLENEGCLGSSPVAIGASQLLGQLSYTDAAFHKQLVLPNSYLGRW
jgi:hypothetical protein